MSAEEVSKGIEFIEATAKRFDLSLGSRHEDFSSRSIRLSLEKTIELGGRRLLRSPVFELSRSFVQDLPSESKYKKALETFLHSLSLRLVQPKPNQFLTLSGVPFEAEIRWPFRQVQTADAVFDDYFVHVFVRIASPRPKEANLTVFISGDEQIQIGPSLSPLSSSASSSTQFESPSMTDVRSFTLRARTRQFFSKSGLRLQRRIKRIPMMLRFVGS